MELPKKSRYTGESRKERDKGLKRLPDRMIDKLQNYFGIALRASTGTSAKHMGDAIWASKFLACC